jgi:PQQ-like domain
MTTKTMMAIAAAVVALACLAAYLGKKKPATPAGNFAAAANSESGPHLAWTFGGDRAIFSSVTLAPDGTIYGGSNQGVFAISPGGSLKWHTQYGGIAYAALGSDGVLYGASMHGLIFGISPDGTVSWKPQVGLTGFHAPPAISGSTILYANNLSDLFAFEQGSSTFTWSKSAFGTGVISEDAVLPSTARVGSTSDSSPMIYSDDSIALPRQHWMHLFGSDGSPTWFIELTSGTLGTGALDGNGSVYAGDGRTLYAVDHSGSLKWKYTPSTGGCCVGSPVVDDAGNIYFSAGPSVYALQPDGTLKWNTKGRYRFGTSPTLVSDGSIYIGTSDGLLALNPDGTEKWKLHSPAANTAPAISADGTAYYACGLIWVCAVKGLDAPLMKSAWPRIHHDSENTGNILTSF